MAFLKNQIKQIPWKFIILLFLLARMITLISAWLGIIYLEFKPTFPYADVVLEKYGSPLFWSWANFDGVHYLMLAEKGYVFGLTQAFFPFYPLMIRFVNYLVGNYLLSGLLISHLLLLASLVVACKLFLLDYPQVVVKKTLIALMLFPTSFFFFSLYTESLFLFLILLSFLLNRFKKPVWAGLVGALASLTKLVGVFLMPVYLWEYWQQKGDKNYRQLLGAFLPLLGLVSYMIYLKGKFNDALLFVHVQEGFGGGRTTDKFILLYQVIWRYLKMVVTVDPHNLIYLTVWLELASALIFLALLVKGFFSGIQKKYLLFALFTYFTPTLTGTFSSMPRYVLVLFPAFIVLGIIKNKWHYRLWLTISVLLLIISTILFTRGHWIA